MAKCLTGLVVVVGAAYYWRYHDIGWCLVSVLLVLSPDSREAVPLAFTRIKANGVAAGICALCLGLLPASYPVIGFALASTIVLCYLGRLMGGCRSALAAIIIIMLHDPILSRAAVWQTAWQRLGSVVIGCGLALLITLVFHRSYHKLRPAGPTHLGPKVYPGSKGA
ncbi:MAG: FUSC family protein [Hymenobacter sp.]|nr:FUSC family protein [Hymenobacter sp.]